MKLDITKEAVKWYENEYEITEITSLRFFVRYGGVGGLVPGFSLGISLEEPNDIYAKKEIDKLTFYIEQEDKWYFEKHDLYIDFNQELNEPEFIYQ